MFRKSRIEREDPELDITSFMSLMIVLVPVLLVMMVFSHITILDLKLPQVGTGDSASQQKIKQLELVVSTNALVLNYPQGILLKSIPLTESGYDYPLLQQALKEVKFLLSEQHIVKKNINLLLTPEIDYQTIVTLMDTIRSYQTVVAASLVNAELFPDISLGDAPDTALNMAKTEKEQAL
ncbi:biopolymer transporter ExbD [Pseudoalteromonas denitrificans]|uniref:Biopolymer transport protein ExbD n=1 Tax=Pseudoalteromonas denitrificans DSM 6059 TaxID=1123010 RepID=A0A1I1SNF0_9GAMM|nr:biopolymer transporter ExbD [Pseudoalteromonas denitrificans]SFD47984.1 Biopolymer transport protein ExbD [Pseudoalteromonas denitrificans DSM 6059]